MLKFKICVPVIAAFFVALSVKASSAVDGVKPSEESRMVYANSLNEAKGRSLKTGKPVFVNCYVDWAGPCKAMDKYVFSDEEFAKYMDKNFVNVFLDMKSPEGKEFAEKYGVDSYPQYFVIDGYGNVIQPIGRSARLPEFKDKVSIATHQATSLAGARKKIDAGKYSKKDLYNYLRAVSVAEDSKEFNKYIEVYSGMLSQKEMLDKKNWDILRFVRDRKSCFYRTVVENKQLFVAKIGAEKVDNYLSGVFGRQLLKYATSDCGVDEINRLGEELSEAAFPDTSVMMAVYNVCKLRSQRDYIGLLKFMDEKGYVMEAHPALRSTIERSFSFNGMKDNERDALREYLRKASEREKGSVSRQLKSLMLSLDKAPSGIDFLHGESFANALAKAKKENKMVFVDCFTSWCGPCRSLATNVFPREDVGKCFNEKFVNVKIDMESGEGPELAKRYRVSAFPTMLFLDADGNVVETLVGFKEAQVLIETAEKVTGK